MKGNTYPSVLRALLLLDALSRTGTTLCPSFPRILAGCYHPWCNYGLIELSIKMILNQVRALTCKEMGTPVNITHLYIRVICADKLGGPDTSARANALLDPRLKGIKRISTRDYSEQCTYVFCRVLTLTSSLRQNVDQQTHSSEISAKVVPSLSWEERHFVDLGNDDIFSTSVLAS